MGYTKGPWRYAKSKQGNMFAVLGIDDDGEECVITYGGCGCCSFHDESIENEDDARVMAASRDLLEALEAFVNYNAEDNGDVSMLSNEELWLKAERAIARAKGEAE